MPYIYQPLTGHDIRVISIQPGTADPEEPICCQLEHVSLPPTPSLSRINRFKGDSHVWPEAHKPYNTSSIFKAGIRPDVHVERTASCLSSEKQADEDQPWRYDWGDYVALSYVWGPTTPTSSITLNGQSFTITRNLFDALLQLRQSQRIQQGFKVWVDAICINQSDNTERSVQVARMRNVYESAWHVVIWIGQKGVDCEIAFTTIRWLSSLTSSEPWIETIYQPTKMIDARPLFVKWPTYKSPVRKSVYRALFDLLTKPYWGRMWILQEVAAARDDAPVLYGNRCLEWKDIYKSARYIASDETRFGRDIVDSVRPRILQTWSFEVARSRVIDERRWASERMWELIIDMTETQKSQKKKLSPTSPLDILRPLLLSREAAVTEEKDRVYGVLGMKDISEKINIVPDYDLSLEKIFVEFSAKLLIDGDINILRLVGRSSGSIYAGWSFDDTPRVLKHSSVAPIAGPMFNSFRSSRRITPVGTCCTHNLPTWVVCWSCRPAPTAQLKGDYTAGGSADSSIMFVSETLSLSTRGKIFDSIQSLSAFHCNEVDTSYPFNSSSSHSSIYGDLEATRAALWRTIVADTTLKGESPAPKSYSWLLDSRIWSLGVAGVYANDFGLGEFMARNMDLNLCGYTLSKLILGRNKLPWWQKSIKTGQFYNPTKEQSDALNWAINALAWRRLVSTEDGRMGLAPASTVSGDVVAIISGCNAPMILRKAADGWQVVGEAYVYGVMNGEIANGDYEFTDITLY